MAFHPALGSPGGAELLAVDQLRFLSDREAEVRLVTFEFDPEYWSDRTAGIEVREVSVSWAEKLRFRNEWRRRRIRARRAAPHFRGADVVLAYNYPCSALIAELDLSCGVVWHCCEPSRSIHLETANPETAARLASSSAPEARCLEVFRNEVALSKKYPRFVEERRADRENVSGMDSVIAISEYSGEMVLRTYGRKVDHIVNPMVRFPRPLSRPSGLHGDGLRVLLHTRLFHHKNADTVLRGFALYRDSDPRATLDIVGEGPERLILEELAESLGLKEGVRFHGYVEATTLEGIYRRCDVLAFLPMDEPFGMVYPEAAARGLLLIGPDHGGPMEILDGGRLGSTVDALSPAALVDVLCEIASLSSAEVDRRREAADRACRQRYAREFVGDKLVDSLQEFALI